jgi:hypothetical protein
MHTAKILTLSCLLAMSFLGGCAAGRPAASAPRAMPTSPVGWLRTELYMGSVSQEAWTVFLRENVTPRFPDGFTALEAYGQWRNPSGEILSIPSRMLVILHPPTPAAEAAIEAIRSEFKARFGHISVLRATTPATVSF